MRSLLLIALAGCAFQVAPLAVDPQVPAAPDLLPAPLPAASGFIDLPDLATLPDLTPAPDQAPPPLVCAQGNDCRINVPGGNSEDIVCAQDSQCDVDCGNGAVCNLVCGKDAECSCKGDGCTLSGCMPMKCKGNTQVCNRKC